MKGWSPKVIKWTEIDYRWETFLLFFLVSPPHVKLNNNSLEVEKLYSPTQERLEKKLPLILKIEGFGFFKKKLIYKGWVYNGMYHLIEKFIAALLRINIQKKARTQN